MSWQVHMIALRLRQQGYKATQDVPFETWLALGFLVTPKPKLLASIDKALAEEGA